MSFTRSPKLSWPEQVELQGELKRSEDYGHCVPMYKLNGGWLKSLKKFTPKAQAPPQKGLGLFAKLPRLPRSIELPRVRNKTASRRCGSPPFAPPSASLSSRTIFCHVCLDKLYTSPCRIGGQLRSPPWAFLPSGLILVSRQRVPRRFARLLCQHSGTVSSVRWAACCPPWP